MQNQCQCYFDAVLDYDSSLPPSSSALPRPQQHGTCRPNGDSLRPKRFRVATCSIAKDIVVVTAASVGAVGSMSTSLILSGINEAPECRAKRWQRCHDSKVGGKVLDAPDNGDNQWCQGKDCSVAGTDQARDDPEAVGVVLCGARGQECQTDGQKSGKEEHECDS